jgi:hypothetical protein
VRDKTLLDAAIRLGEEQAERAIKLDIKIRRVKWRIQVAKHMLKTGRASAAMTVLTDLLEELQRDYTIQR